MNEMLAFARLHDWGFDAEIVEGGLRVGVEVQYADGRWAREFTVVRTMRELRDWAGY